jgi:autotransporter-associated beta strand protein
VGQSPLAILCLAALLLLPWGQAWALNDSLTLTVTNSWTHLPVTINLQRYNLRATNYQVRIFSDATTYTLLPTNQIPEVTTYRGRITGDPGAVVTGAFDINGNFHYAVTYGCRYQKDTTEYDPYDTTNRLSWGAQNGGGGDLFIQTTNIPSLGYVTNYSVVPTNLPQHINWSSANYPAAPAVSYGGPPYLNVLKQVPVQRARLVLDSDLNFFNGKVGGNVNSAVLLQECRLNNVDFEQARDLGVCYQIVCVCVRTNTQLPYTLTTGNLSEETSFWKPDPGYSHGVAANGWFDMVHGAISPHNGASGWAADPGDFSVMSPDWPGFPSGHEMGHNWGQNHYTSVRDYTGDNFWHVAMDGSGFGYSTVDANIAQVNRRTGSKGGIEWVKYNFLLPPHATPDLATTKTNQAVSVNVLLNDYIANSNTLSIVSFETNTLNGGVVANLGSGVLRYTPAAGFIGYDLFHYYVGEPSGLKSLTAAKVLVTSDSAPLLGQWQFNGTTGTSAGETTGNGQAATLYGSANFGSDSVPGVGGGTALHFDGSGYARFQGTWFDPYNTNMSISLWVKPDATPGGEQMLLMKSSLDANNSPGLRLGMTGSTFFFSGCTVGGQSSFNVNAGIVPQPGIWYHLVGEIDRTSGLIRLYVNGVEFTGTSSTRTIPAGEFIAADNWPCLGMANDGGGNKSWFAGAIDDLRLYTKALSASEVQALYAGAGLLPAGGPHPADGEINAALQPPMTWTPGGTNNFQYNVYLGTNSANVTAATTNSVEFQGRVSVASFTPSAALAANTTYYWRVDELYGTNVVASPVWAFNTAVDAIHGGLKLYLSLDARDTVGTNTYDRSGNFNDGALYSSPLPTSGQVYEGLAFNGTSAYVETPALNLNTSNVTFLAWINSVGAQNSSAGLIFCRSGSTISGLNFRGTSGQLGYYWNGVSNPSSFVSNLSPPTNQWSLVALTIQNNRAIFYLGTTNGVLSIATNNYTHVLQAFDSPLYLAYDTYSGGGRYFNGAMDEVGVWNRVLSAAEIGQILTNGINGASFGGPRPVADPNTFTWIGDTDVYWTNSLNWATNGVPGSANTVFFNDSAAGNTATQLGTNLSVAGVNISGGLRAVGVFGTNTLTIGAGGISMTNTSANLTLGALVSLGAAQTWLVPDGSTLTLTNKLSGSGNPRLTKDGDGTLNLNNNTSGSSYSGVIFVNAGTLSLPYGWNTPSVTGNVSVGTNGTLVFNTHPYSYGTDNYTTNAGTMIVNGGNQLANLELRGGQVTGTGSLRVGDLSGTSNSGHWAARSNSITATIGVASLSLYTVNTTFTVENGTADPDLLVSCPMNDGANGSASFTKAGLGSLTLTQPNTYTGNTTNSAGTLNLSGPDNVLPVGTTLFLASNTTLNMNGINQTVASLVGFGAMNLGSGSFTDNEAGTSTFGGVISGNPGGLVADDTVTAPPGGIAMNGTGKLTLTNAQTYSGDTWVSSGTLALSGVGSISSSSNLVVASGAKLDASARADSTLKLVSGQTLSGFGSVLGKVVVTNGATISPGDNNNDLGALTLNSTLNLTGGQARMKISKSGVALANDSLAGITTLTYGGTLVVTNVTSDATPLAPGDSFKLFNATAYTGSFANYNLPPLAANLLWNTSQLATSGTLSVITLTTPVLSGTMTVGGSGMQLSFSGNNGQTYKVLGSTNITLPMASWQVLTNGTFGAGPASFTDTANIQPVRFYRIVSP